MLVHRIAAPLKRLLPGFIWRPLRRVMTAVLTPLHFSRRTGHFGSALRARAIDRRGRAIPWYTYACVDFLRDKEFAGRDLLEFGSGQSTAWWAERARRIVTFEANEAWYREVKAGLPANVTIHHVPHELDGVETLIGNDTFDIIVVDGLDRVAACRLAYPFLRPGGALLLDNAEGYPEAMAFFREQGVSRIDFYGHAAGVILPHCTSLFFRETCFLFEGARDPIGDPASAD